MRITNIQVKEAKAVDELRAELEGKRGEIGRLQEAMEALESQKQASEAEAKAHKTKLDAERRDREVRTVASCTALPNVGRDVHWKLKEMLGKGVLGADPYKQLFGAVVGVD